MLTQRTSLGIAQTIFYIPISVLAIFILFFRRQSPRYTWYCLTIFSLARLAGGIVSTIFEDGNESVSLFISVLVLLTIGTVPLIASTFFLGQMILRHGPQKSDQRLGKIISIIFRVAFLGDIGILAAGAGLVPNSSSYTKGEAFLKAGYIVLGCILAFLIAFTIYLWLSKARLRGIYTRYLVGATMALPFLVVRVVYAFLSIFDSGDYPFYESKWSYFKGSLVAYIIMGLLMEYVVACIYIFVGMTTRLLKESNGGNN